MSATKLLLTALLVLYASGARAFELAGPEFPEAGQLLSVDDEWVEIHFTGASASMEDEFIFDATQPDGSFNCNSAQAGDVFPVGAFSGPTALNFFLRNPWEEFSTGPGQVNGDGIPHARLRQTGPHVVQLGFEDLGGGGDFDYDDCTVDIVITPLK